MCFNAPRCILVASSNLKIHSDDCAHYFQWLSALVTTFNQKQFHGSNSVETSKPDNSVISQHSPMIL